jgi:uncharacterized membrane protein YhhN
LGDQPPEGDMEKTILVPAASLFLLGLLIFERKSNIFGILFTKPVVSVLFVVTALVQRPLTYDYYAVILIALMLCLIGDVCLIFQESKKMFIAGLVAFLSGHIAYISAFYGHTRMNAGLWAALIVFAVLGTLVYRWIRPNLGTLKIPVVVYILVITTMVTCAVSMFGNPALISTGRFMVLAGALSFYTSDILVARDRFVMNAYVNRLIGLPLYFLGQFLFALSIAYVG